MNSFLRSLSIDQHIQLLFILVVCLLLILTWFITRLAKREKKANPIRSSEHRQQQKQYRSIIQSSWAMTIVFWLAWLGGTVSASILFALVSFWILREFITMSKTNNGDHYGISIAFFIVLPLQYFLAWQMNWLLFIVFIPVVAFLTIPLINALSGEITNFAARVEKIQMGLMVCVYGLSHIPALMNIELGNQHKSYFLPIFLVLVVQICILVQFLLQQFKPLKPSLPNVSNRFNWYYCLVGIACGALIGEVLSPFTPLSPGNATFMAILACVAGSCGHILLKAFKCSYGITAWKEHSLDGSAALLDKIGALCFAAPVFFHSIMYYFKLL